MIIQVWTTKQTTFYSRPHKKKTSRKKWKTILIFTLALLYLLDADFFLLHSLWARWSRRLYEVTDNSLICFTAVFRCNYYVLSSLLYSHRCISFSLLYTPETIQIVDTILIMISFFHACIIVNFRWRFFLLHSPWTRGGRRLDYPLELPRRAHGGQGGARSGHWQHCHHQTRRDHPSDGTLSGTAS